MSLQPRDWQSTETQPLGVCLSGDSSYFLLACHQMHFEAGNLIDIYLEDVEEQFRLLQTARHCPLIAGELCNSGTTCRLRLSEALWGCPSVGRQMPSSRDSSRNGSCSWQNPVLLSPQIHEVMAFWNPWNAWFWRFQFNPSVECSSSVSGSGLCFLFYFFFKIFHFMQRFGGKSACLLAFHLKNSCKIPLLCLSPFQMEAVHVILGTWN